jgi:putative SOS response-associated peptidase YedK
MEGELNVDDPVQRRWSWPGRTENLVYNFRSDGRKSASGRCLLIADSLFEFTDPRQKGEERKDKWLSRRMMRGLNHADHARPGRTSRPTMQVAILERDARADWLDPSSSAKSASNAWIVRSLRLAG